MSVFCDQPNILDDKLTLFHLFTVTSIYAIEANNVREINFPAEGSDHWGRMGDSLTMPAEALRENSDGGLVRLVCFAYNNLEHVCNSLICTIVLLTFNS